MPMFLEYLLMFSLMNCEENCVCLIGKRLKKKNSNNQIKIKYIATFVIMYY